MVGRQRFHPAASADIFRYSSIIMNTSRVVVLTGAGISAESGIRTFRDNNGLWEEHSIEDVATPRAWASNPELVWRFYQARRRQLLEVEPNQAHRALADLSTRLDNMVLITQNVDDLHERGGSKNVWHMHGELSLMRCELSNQATLRMAPEDLEDTFLQCECCEQPSRMRPHIVWFGEQPLGIEQIYRAVESCDVFVVVGSSGHVYPAAGLVEVANTAGARTVLVNLEPPSNAEHFDEVHLGRAGDVLPMLVDRWSTRNLGNEEPRQGDEKDFEEH